VAESTGQPTFADAGWPAQDQIVVRLNRKRDAVPVLRDLMATG
jgi:hypothetical protein